ncbi:MAG: hypothetical protein V8S42_07155 [Lachnospiraceae bacterium]
MMGIGAVGSYEYGYGYGYGVDISPFGSAAAGGTVRQTMKNLAVLLSTPVNPQK